MLNGNEGDDQLIGDSYICGAGNDIAVQFNRFEGDRRTADCEQ
jgi:hypothetical protein